MSTTGVRLTSVWAAVALLLVAAVGVAQASPPTAASATFTQTVPTGFDISFAGPNVILEQTTVGSVSGDWSGTFKDSLSLLSAGRRRHSRRRWRGRGGSSSVSNSGPHEGSRR